MVNRTAHAQRLGPGILSAALVCAIALPRSRRRERAGQSRPYAPPERVDGARAREPVAPVVAVSLQLKMGTRWETRANAGISKPAPAHWWCAAPRSSTGPKIVEAAEPDGRQHRGHR